MKKNPEEASADAGFLAEVFRAFWMEGQDRGGAECFDGSKRRYIYMSQCCNPSTLLYLLSTTKDSSDPFRTQFVHGHDVFTLIANYSLKKKKNL